jgi:acetolactate synthase regulatory subunit
MFSQLRAALSQGHRPSTVRSSRILRLTRYYGAVVLNVEIHAAVHNSSRTVPFYVTVTV